MEQYHGTTSSPAPRHQVALGGHGQVTLGNIVVKAGAQVRPLYQDDLAGFAGAPRMPSPCSSA